MISFTLIYRDTTYGVFDSIVIYAKSFREASSYASKWCRISQNLLVALVRSSYSVEVSSIISNLK